MGSGKSTLLREYAAPKLDFLTPPGLRSDFFDVSFGQLIGDCVHYYYELDSPTVLGAAWIEYVKVADGIIIVYDCLEGERYGTLAELVDYLLTKIKLIIPLLFVANKALTVERGLSDLKDRYDSAAISKRKFSRRVVEMGAVEADSHGMELVRLDVGQIEDFFNWMNDALHHPI